jgi:hypothetical protein
VNPGRFLAELPGLFDDYPHSEAPRDGRFAEIVDAVSGLAEPNNLALVNLAARLLAPGESYVEAGSYHGRSLIAAMLDNAGRDFVAIDDFSLGDGSRRQLEANLERFGLSGATVLEGDAFEVLRSGALGDRVVGVYYYDAGHAYEQQLDGLRLAEQYLASPALVIVDDSDWERVARATRDYLAGQPRARLALELPGKEGGRPQWWEGMQILVWDDGEGAS